MSLLACLMSNIGACGVPSDDPESNDAQADAAAAVPDGGIDVAKYYGCLPGAEVSCECDGGGRGSGTCRADGRGTVAPCMCVAPTDAPVAPCELGEEQPCACGYGFQSMRRCIATSCGDVRWGACNCTGGCPTGTGRYPPCGVCVPYPHIGCAGTRCGFLIGGECILGDEPVNTCNVECCPTGPGFQACCPDGNPTCGGASQCGLRAAESYGGFADPRYGYSERYYSVGYPKGCVGTEQPGTPDPACPEHTVGYVIFRSQNDAFGVPSFEISRSETPVPGCRRPDGSCGFSFALYGCVHPDVVRNDESGEPICGSGLAEVAHLDAGAGDTGTSDAAPDAVARMDGGGTTVDDAGSYSDARTDAARSLGDGGDAQPE